MTRCLRWGLFSLTVLVLLGSAGAAATDWPQFLGPERNGVYTGPPVADTWPASGPRVLWRKPVGAGFAGPVVVNGRLILFHRQGSQEVVESLDVKTGASGWRYAYPTSYRDDFGFDEGPRAAPVVAGGVVYTFGAEGQLHAIDLARGTRLWSEDTMKRFGVPKGFFGASGSPLVEGGRVIANIGGGTAGSPAGVVAFDARTGKVVWRADPRHDKQVPISGTPIFMGDKIITQIWKTAPGEAVVQAVTQRGNTVLSQGKATYKD